MFKESTRRIKQQILQGVGVAEPIHDDDLQNEYSEYKETCEQVKNIKKLLEKHLVAMSVFYESAYELSKALARFGQDESGNSIPIALEKSLSKLVRVQLSSAKRLFDEEAFTSAEQLMQKSASVKEKIRERRKLLLDHDIRSRRYAHRLKSDSQSHADTSSGQDINALPPESEWSSFDQNATLPKSNSFFKFISRRSTEQDMSEELATRKAQLQTTEHKVNISSEWLLKHFNLVKENRSSGMMFEKSISSIISCHIHLMGKFTESLELVTSKCSHVDTCLAKLEEYDELELAGQRNKLLPSAGKRSSLSSNRSGDGTVVSVPSSSSLKSNHAVQGLVFGRPLDSGSPQILQDCVEYIRENGLETEGIFRVSGAQVLVEHVKEKYDKGETVQLSSVEKITVHDVCTLLKLWLSELGQPLIPPMQYRLMLDTIRNDKKAESEATVQTLIKAVESIPPMNLSVITSVLDLLHEVLQHSEKNKMTAQNIATCVTPSILCSRAQVSITAMASDVVLAISVMRVVVENAKTINRVH